MSDGSEKRPLTKMFWSVSIKTSKRMQLMQQVENKSLILLNRICLSMCIVVPVLVVRLMHQAAGILVKLNIKKGGVTNIQRLK